MSLCKNLSSFLLSCTLQMYINQCQHLAYLFLLLSSSWKVDTSTSICLSISLSSRDSSKQYISPIKYSIQKPTLACIVLLISYRLKTTLQSLSKCFPYNVSYTHSSESEHILCNTSHLWYFLCISILFKTYLFTL